MSEQAVAPIPDMPFGRTLRYRVEALGFFALMGFFGLFVLDRASAMGGWLGRKVFYRSGVTRRARENLRHAYPEMSEAEREKIVVEMWDCLGRTVAEYAHLDKMTIHGPDPRLTIANVDIADREIAKGKGILFISGHFANWETMAFAATQYGVEGGEVYRPVNNPYIDRWMVRQRMKNGPQDQIAKGAAGTRRIFSLLRAGKSIFLLVDQKTNEGLPSPFFGRDAMTTPAPAALALKLGCTVVPIANERIGGGAHFRMTVHPPIAFAPSGDHDHDVQALTNAITAAIEQMVRCRPSQWLWIHRRWPKEGDRLRSKRALELAEKAAE